MISLRRMTLGSGYRYLMESVAVGDGAIGDGPGRSSSLTRYYAESGTPPGVFLGAGLAALDRNKAVCVPGFLNKFVAVSPRFGPRGVTRGISAGVMKRLEAPQAPAPG